MKQLYFLCFIARRFSYI